MATTLAQKLRIKEGTKIFAMHAPGNYLQSLGHLPNGAAVIKIKKGFDQLHWFVTNKAEMEKELIEVLSLVSGDVLCWIMYPKGTSKLQTDLTRDKGWEALLKHDMQWVSLISFDDTWSAFGMRQKTEKDKKKAEKPRERPVFDYVDAKTKSVKLPEDLAILFKKNKNEKEAFDALSFTNKKEYIEWIVSAKREDTRTTRVHETVERLKKGWKNPANR